jgi:hypothetical protein
MDAVAPLDAKGSVWNALPQHRQRLMHLDVRWHHHTTD